MFDVTANADILLGGLYFRHYEGIADVTVFTAPGSYIDKFFTPDAWTQIAYQSITVQGEILMRNTSP